MIRAIQKSMGDFAAIIGLMVIGALVGGYILSNQRLRFPWEDQPFKLRAEFSTAQAVTPGQGQTVRVSGVRVGDIAKVDLERGRAIVTMDLDQEFKDLVHTDASALLRPKTGLKDMFIELYPGSKSAPVAEENWVMPVRNTLPDINPDEVFKALDADSRDYLKLLVNGAGEGLEGRGSDLQEVFRRFEPTHRDLAAVTTKVAERERNLRRLVHSLDELNAELGAKDDDLAQLVEASAAVFRSFASEERNVSAAVGQLPDALAETTKTLGKVESFARVLRPSVTELRPAVRKLDAANKALTDFARSTTPVVRDEIRPFARDARPLVRKLGTPVERLATSTPDLNRSFVVLNGLLNMVGYNRDGREGPEKGAARDEGFLFWIAWLNHNGASLFGSGDAHGPYRPVAAGANCSTIKQILETEGGGQLAALLAPAFMDDALCGSSTRAKIPDMKALYKRRGKK